MNGRMIACFWMETAPDPAMPTYAGGVDALAGATIRSDAGLNVPMVAVPASQSAAILLGRSPR